LVARIGLRSTGLVVFGGRVVSAFTGLAFTVMVARWLVPAQLGLWEFVIDIVTFASYPIGVVAFWVTRDIARGMVVGRTAVLAGAAMSIAGHALYFLLTFLTYSSVTTVLLPFLLGSLLVPLSYWNQVSNSIVQGYRPVALGYSLIVSEFSKLAVAYPALYIYKLGIEGVILALIVSYLCQSLISTYLVRGALTDTLRMAQARQWFQLYDQSFWQQRFWAAGYREFPNDAPHSEWTVDVDAGPVIAGHGVAASAFGMGAARRNGRFDRAKSENQRASI
jgi:O-antigen/teichoic acid export membrane protein